MLENIMDYDEWWNFFWKNDQTVILTLDQHSRVDNRKKGELESKKQSDPLLITSQRLQEDFGVSEADIEAIHQKIEEQAQEAYKFAENSELPDLAKLYDYVYASNDE